MVARTLFLLFLFVSGVAQAQIYKWVGSDGKMNYSDMPPPTSVSNVETKSISVSDQNSALPYELAQVAKNMPVTLYSADSVPQSLDARNFLMKNGIPFTEKTVSTKEDIDKFNQISGGLQIPVLFVGKYKLTGFNPSEWRTTLTQAGYPDSNVLPANYRFATPQPLVQTTLTPNQPKTPLEAQADEKNNPTSSQQPAQPARNPNGFQF